MGGRHRGTLAEKVDDLEETDRLWTEPRVYPGEHCAMEPKGLSHILLSGGDQGWRVKLSEPLNLPDSLELNKGPRVQIRSVKAQRPS